MINHINLLKEILNLNNEDAQALIDSNLSAQELIFADKDYLKESKMLNIELISKLSQLRALLSEITMQQLKEKVIIKTSTDVIKYLALTLRTLSVEHLVVLFLNKKNAIIDHIKIRGSFDSVKVDYRFIIKRALIAEAASVICAHNHPSGNASPSEHDKIITESLQHVLAYLNIKLLDHLIISSDAYYSFMSKKKTKYKSLTKSADSCDNVRNEK